MIRRLYRRLRGTCPGCGYPRDSPVRAVVDEDEDPVFCDVCGGPHIIYTPVRCDACGALMDDDERMYADDDSEMEYQS